MRHLVHPLYGILCYLDILIKGKKIIISFYSNTKLMLKDEQLIFLKISYYHLNQGYCLD